MANRDNLPGMAYLRRLGTAYAEAARRQADEAGRVWNAIKDRKCDHHDLYQPWMIAVESYYDILLEASRGPAYAPQPRWFQMAHTRGAAGTLEGTPQIDTVQPQGTNIEATDFASL